MLSTLRKFPVTIAIVSFVLFSVLAAIAMPDFPERYFSEEKAKFDANIYLDIASRGYSPALIEEDAKGYPAMYPLWPLTIRSVWMLTGTEGSVVVANLLALTLFFLSLPLIYRVFLSTTSGEIAAAMLLMFALNPNSVFHAIPYSESLFCLLSGIFLLYLHRYLDKQGNWPLFGIFISAAALSLTRPVLIQLCLSGWLAVLFVFLRFGHSRAAIYSALALSLGAGSGYALYGFYCQNIFHDFFYPFTLQALWGREFGLYWQLFYAPKAVSGSVHILFWDLLAFYIPMVIAVLALAKRSRGSINEKNYVFWFCAIFAATHSAIAFTTYPIFMSLGRHVFALPFLFYALAATVSSYQDRPVTRRILVFFIVVSISFFFNWWSRYARGAWMG